MLNNSQTRTAFLVVATTEINKTEIEEAEEVVAIGFADEPEDAFPVNDPANELSAAKRQGYAFISVAFNPAEAEANVANYLIARGISPQSIKVTNVPESKLNRELLPNAKTRKMPGMVSKLESVFVLPDEAESHILEFERFCKALYT